MRIFSKAAPLAFLSFLFLMLPFAAWSGPTQIGIVIMHGKGGSPSTYVADLATALNSKGYLVANIEMPWSGRRDYDVDVSHAEEEVEAALAGLRARGAARVFVAGHSQGGAFALHLAKQHKVDGIIAIAPGGDVGSRIFIEKLGESVVQAQQLAAEGKGNEKTRLFDYEGKKGTYPVVTTPANYLSWFSPAGAMGMHRAAREANPGVPILWLVAKNDYPGLIKQNIPLFDTLPRNPLTRMARPDSDHLGAPYASLDEIVAWTTQVANP
jgi:pimeloyl-ACP methyl ester carboxylesterase